MTTEDEAAAEIPKGLDPDVRERVITHEALTVNIDKMHHEATAGRFTFSSDEPAELVGRR